MPGPAATARVVATLTGSDIYRLNCQACHGPGGAGTPQAPALTKAARSLAAGDGDEPLRQRLGSGGRRMPAFPHLARSEVDALIAHLTEVGGGEVAAAPTVAALTGPALGERIYRSNCGSCHESGQAAASGMMCRPASLVGATDRFSKQQVMNLLDVGVGPMPAFGHLTAAERDALWAYLGTLPPEPGSPPTMGQMCPMVRAAMEGRRMGGMMSGRGMGPGMMGGGPMGRGMMGGPMMRGGMGCPMMRGDSPAADGGQAPAQPPPCCR